jgi:hypothetical protein
MQLSSSADPLAFPLVDFSHLEEREDFSNLAAFDGDDRLLASNGQYPDDIEFEAYLNFESNVKVVRYISLMYSLSFESLMEGFLTCVFEGLSVG